MKKKTGQEWIDALEEVGVPCGPINNMEQVFDHRQVQERGMKIDLEHPIAGTVPQVASPIRFIGEQIEYQGAPPTLGQHSLYVLSDVLGLTKEKIAELQERDIIGK